jgi:hypothetical protein
MGASTGRDGLSAQTDVRLLHLNSFRSMRHRKILWGLLTTLFRTLLSLPLRSTEMLEILVDRRTDPAEAVEIAASCLVSRLPPPLPARSSSLADLVVSPLGR